MKKAWKPRGLTRPTALLKAPTVLAAQPIARRRRPFATVAQDSRYFSFPILSPAPVCLVLDTTLEDPLPSQPLT